jgi:hypothetical protein
MANYKNSFTTKENYIKMLLDNYKLWIKHFAEGGNRAAYDWKIEDTAKALIQEGFDWEYLEALEIEVLKEIA